MLDCLRCDHLSPVRLLNMDRLMTASRNRRRGVPLRGRFLFTCNILVAALVLVFPSSSLAASNDSKAGFTRFQSDVLPILKEYCFDCHGDGMNKGKVAFDEFKTQEDLLAKQDLWLAVLKNVR